MSTLLRCDGEVTRDERVGQDADSGKEDEEGMGREERREKE